MDRVWTQRNVPYRACLISLISGIVPFLMGFGAPHWLWFSRMENGTEETGSFGLWALCIDGECFSNDILGNKIVDDWFLAVVIFQSLALPFYLIALMMVIVQNFSRIRWIRTISLQKLRQLLHKDSEVPEDLAFISGFLSFFSIILFMVNTADLVSNEVANYSWGFAMTFVGSSVLVISGVLMCKAHSPMFTRANQPAEPRVVHTLSSTIRQSPQRRPESHSLIRTHSLTGRRSRSQAARLDPL